MADSQMSPKLTAAGGRHYLVLTRDTVAGAVL
jgi:hypothetical protein